MAETIYREEFLSALDAIPEVRDRVLDALLTQGCIPAERAFCMRLCIEEALANAVRHGNGCDPNRSVRIEALNDNDVCVLRVYDEGPGFDPDTCVCPEPEHIGGRGVCIIRHYMNSIIYNSDMKCLEMTFPRAQQCEGATAHAATA